MALLTETRARFAAQRAVTQFRKDASTLLVEDAATERKSFDIFLSHSIKDAELVHGTRAILQSFGFTVYVDWIVDPTLPRTQVTPATAAVLRQRVRQCQSLLYLKTDNSTDSTWMPWELGFFDAFNGRVAILPVAKAATNQFAGNEYLGLYPYADVANISGKQEETLWVNRTGDGYASFRAWLNDIDAIKKH